MISAFYFLALLFFLNEVYHLFNKNRLDLLFEKKDPENIRKIDIIYYVLRVGSAIWPFIGLFSSYWGLFSGIILAGLFKFAAYHADDILYSAYSRYFYPIISMIIYLSIFIVGFIR